MKPNRSGHSSTGAKHLSTRGSSSGLTDLMSRRGHNTASAPASNRRLRTAATVGNIVLYIDASLQRRRRAVGAALIAFWVVTTPITSRPA